MTNTYTIRALLLTADPLLITTFNGISSELGIQSESSPDPEVVSYQLNRARYEAVVLDFDTVSNAGSALASIHQSSSNKAAVVFAAATNATHINQALEGRAHFLLRKPIEAPIVRRTLYSAYDLMLGGQRRYFRCAASLQVEAKIIRSGENFGCSTINISGNGMAISSPIALRPAEMLDISLLLPDQKTVHATGIVVWGDQNGKTGVNFRCSDPEMRHRLDSWLDTQFSTRRADPIRSLIEARQESNSMGQ